MIIDSHAHLLNSIRSISAKEHPHCLAWDGEKVVVRELASAASLPDVLRAEGIAASVEPATTLASNYEILDFCAAHEGVYAACGIHPTRLYVNKREADGSVTSVITTKGKYRELEALIKENRDRISAIKTGLDFHRPPFHRHYQIRWFKRLVRLSVRLELPLVLHIRMADRTAIRVLRRYRGRIRGSVHCFTGGWQFACAYTEKLGLCLGIGGFLLNEGDYLPGMEESVIRTSPEKLLLETDCPYVQPPYDPGKLTPHQRRAVVNSPLILPAVARRIAALKGMTGEEVERVTADNARTLFGMKE